MVRVARPDNLHYKHASFTRTAARSNGNGDIHIHDVGGCKKEVRAYHEIFEVVRAIADTLTAYGPIGVQVLQDAIAGLEASGKTAQSIRFEVESSEKKDTLRLLGRKYFDLLEKGIRPSDKNPPPEMIAFLTDYARARGMDNPEKAAWGIAKTILAKGDKTYRQGGRIVYSDDLDKFVQELKTYATQVFAKGFLTEVTGAFKSGSND
jgi:hypothetical protein